jgi:hypothetical protein
MRKQSECLQTKALAQFGGEAAMALQAQSAHVREVAFAATFAHRNNVIGIPKRLSAAHLPAFAGLEARRSSKASDAVPLGDTIDPAGGADASIAFKNSFPKMSRIAAQSPFLNTEIGAECEASGWNLQIAPAAEASAIRPFRQGFALGSSAGHGSLFTHR